MGYHGKRLQDTIAIKERIPVTLSYPKSDSGGRVSGWVDFSKDIDINIETFVDSQPFEESVVSCNKQVNTLTGAVVATETAEVIAKAHNAKKVGNSLTTGFFNYIRSEISQQIAELKIRTDSILAHLTKQGENCVSKQKQMEGDYSRIKERYGTTFEELNKETRTRIMQLDKPVFVFVKESQSQLFRSTGNSLLNVTIFGDENSTVQSKMYSSGLKQRGLSILRSADSFLRGNKYLQKEIHSILQNEAGNTALHVPIVYLETNDENNGVTSKLCTNSKIKAFQSNKLINDIKQTLHSPGTHWEPINEEGHRQIGDYLKQEIKQNLSADKAQNERIARLTMSFWNNSPIQVLSN